MHRWRLNGVKRKILNFLEKPHFPCFLSVRIQRRWPTLARLLKYGRINPNTAQYWNQRYFTGDYQEGEDAKYLPLRQEIVGLVPPFSKVLDAGCGTGKLLEMLRDQRRCECVGVDISDVSIELVKEKGFEGFTCQLPSLPLNLDGRTFDVCLLIETLEHVSNPVKTLKSLSEIVKDNGLMIISVPDGCMKPEEFDEHISSFDSEALSQLLGSDFRVTDLFRSNCAGASYLVLAARKQGSLITTPIDPKNGSLARRQAMVRVAGNA